MTVDTRTYAPDFVLKINGVDFRHGANIDILSISITESATGSDSFQISVRDRHPVLERFPNGEELKWMDSDQFEDRNEVEIELGYVQNRTLRFVGLITAVAISFPESGVPTLTIQGQSLYKKLQEERTSKPFASKRDGDIVREIAGRLKLTAQVDETNTEHETVSYVGSTYAAILQERAERLHYEVGVKQRTLHFQKPRYLVSTSPALTLTWGERLLSFNPRLSTSNMPTTVIQRSPQTARGGDKMQPIVSQTTADEFTPRLGRRSGPQIVKEKGGNTVVLSSDHRVETPEEGQAHVQAKMRERALGFVQGDGATIGTPELVARTVIELKGLGKKFSGKYYVTSTTHTIDASGYRTTFSVKRDAI